MSATIAVEELRVGMVIHLDGGWLSHPFPLSTFRIASVDQIATVRGLGLARVRWSPEKSELPVPEVANVADVAAGASAPSAADNASVVPLARADAALPLHAELSTEAVRRQWLAQQRDAAQRCERQYGEAAKVYREAQDAVLTRPAHAGRTSEALTRAMLDKMLGSEDIGIRLVSGGGDRNAAHALNVAVISMLIGRTLGLGEQDMQDIGVGALLHDAGKLEVVDRCRHAEEGFSSAELAAYRDHVPKGVALGTRMGLSPGALAVLAQHHEHADGTGFPDRLNSDRMNIGARIVAIVNRYDNLCNPGSRAPALTPHEAVAMLFAQGRLRFDAAVLGAFIRMMGVYPAGSLVQLTDDRYGLVVGVNSSRPLKPRVLVHDAPAGRSPGAASQLIDLECVPDLGIRRSLAAHKIPAASLQVLDPRPRVAYYFEPMAREADALGQAA
jgi:HD-GYP domain-containing protein (c-di-GMP phosphodiesterase class II)